VALMLVVLARHGNTFEPNQPPVWVGARTDLPLVARGQEQAAEIGKALKATRLVPRRALAGPLKRTQETARLALAAAGASDRRVETEPRLREIDYGNWEGKSSDEICRVGGGEELRAWEQENVWPSLAAWPSSSSDYVAGFLDVLESVRHGGGTPTLIVSSNGIFKLLAASLVGGGPPRKMATGHLSVLRLESSGIQLLCWDLAPGAFIEWIGHNAV
jgi:broad specificity phosphatase PhoE